MYCFQGDKYKDQELDALDLFKECHYSNKKNGYTVAVQSAIVRKFSNKARNANFLLYLMNHICCLHCQTQMETKITEPVEDQETRSVTEVLVDVLAQYTKKNIFLQNVGIQNNQPTSAGQNLQAKLMAHRENPEL